MSAVITGSVNVIATGVLIYGVDNWGRRSLFLEGGTQMLICQVAIAIFIGINYGIDGNPGNQSHLGNMLLAYDGKKSAFAAGPLPFESKEFVVKLTENNGREILGRFLFSTLFGKGVLGDGIEYWKGFYQSYTNSDKIIS
ncbi:hypothetical protein L2E82_13912 [Cichorium intybus]|uniref:Uncharacterized protein n=1 Tax=Cichorium intybus TaxID=13427 RepID=A0ACB9EXZ7_CICIN|nr:hypothetical protein L2E82_13912 [Cichorium intybus]